MFLSTKQINKSIQFLYLYAMPKKFTFTKAERLKSRKVIASLFAGGESFGAYPLRVVWREMEEAKSGSPVQVSFSVPKKRFKTAVARNLLKRRMREAYRLSKHKVYRKREGQEKQLAVMLIYTGKEEMNYTDIDKSMGKIIWRLGKIGDANWKAKKRK